jgi:hypothetical protein
VICQLDHKGRLLILQEIISEDMGLELHIQAGLRPALAAERYLGKPIAVIGDPAGRSKDSLYEENCFDLLKRNGFMAYPAPTNDIEPRLRAVEALLLSQRDGGSGAEYSHVADALQYACLAVHGGMQGLITRQLTRGGARPPRERMPARAWT